MTIPTPGLDPLNLARNIVQYLRAQTYLAQRSDPGVDSIAAQEAMVAEWIANAIKEHGTNMAIQSETRALQFADSLTATLSELAEARRLLLDARDEIAKLLGVRLP